MPPGHELPYELGVDHRTSLAYPFQRVDKVVGLHYSALQEVADAVPTLEQVERRVDLDVRREHEDPDLGELAPNRPGSLQPFLIVGRRHSDVDDHEVRGLIAAGRLERQCVAGLADDVVTGSAEHAGDAFAHEDVVVRHHNALPVHPGPELTPTRV